MIVPVVVLFKTPQKTIDCLLSDFTTIGIPKKDIIFIDNTKNNKGFAHGANRGIKQALKRKPTTILLVNPDVRFTKIEKGDILAAQTKFSIFGGVIKDKSKIYYGGEIDRWYMSGGMREQKPKEQFSPVDFVSGSFMGISPACIKKIGYLREDYFMYYEDVEYCKRATNKGLSVGTSTKLVYRHNESSDSMFLQKKQYLARNRLKFLNEYGTVLQKVRSCIKMVTDFLVSSSSLLNK